MSGNETPQAHSGTAPDPRVHPRRRRERVIAACNICKLRKVKCDGHQPCGYCRRRGTPDSCAYSITARQRGYAPPLSRDSSQPLASGHSDEGRQNQSDTRSSATTPQNSEREELPRADEDTFVPREAGLLCDAQGKLIFIGDTAPLSFLQTVRHLITSRVDPNGLAAPTSRDSLFEHVPTRAIVPSSDELKVPTHLVNSLVAEYLAATSGLVDLFDASELDINIHTWAQLPTHPEDVVSAVYYLVLAIGSQERDTHHADVYFSHARNIMLGTLNSNMNIATIRGFVLVSIYLLRAFQPNGSFLFFSLASRTAYSIGIHRTEVNAHFGPTMHDLRDRIWKSIRIVDLFISCSLGRPPATSDVDCTVSYQTLPSRTSHQNTSENDIKIIDASVQVFQIIERIIVEIYSRKQVSVQQAESVSHQLKDWASEWLQKLCNYSITQHHSSDANHRRRVVGTCQVLCSYYYGVMLLTRPFLINELHAYLAITSTTGFLPQDTSSHPSSNRSKLAYAALDAAILFVELVEKLISNGYLQCRMPLVVSWLFTTSLVLGIALLGQSGGTFEKHAKASVKCLEYFAKRDPHAKQYCLIADSLVKTAQKHIETVNLRQQRMRTQTSSQLFGLFPNPSNTENSEAHNRPQEGIHDLSITGGSGVPSAEGLLGNTRVIEGLTSTGWGSLDEDFFSISADGSGIMGQPESNASQSEVLDSHDDPLGNLPLFPVFDNLDTFDFNESTSPFA